MRRLLLTLPLAVLAGLLPTAHAEARSDQRTIFQTPRELRSADAALRARTLDEIRGLGVGWLRLVVYWKDVAPRPDTTGRPRFDEREPAAYDWSRYDRVIGEADARGLRLLLTVSGPVPRWATSGARDNLTRPSAVRFGRFTEAVARRYGTVADAFSIWNEPNHPAYLLPQWTGSGPDRRPASATHYRRLFQKGAAGLAAGGAGRVPVLFGETAPRGTGRVVHPRTFLRVALCLDGRWRLRPGCRRVAADGYAHHPYTVRGGPSFVPPNHEDITIGVLPRLNSALARAGRAGAVRKGLPIWITEFGIQSFPDRIIGVSETTQAEYRSMSERLAAQNPRVVAFSQYLMRDDDPDPTAASALARHPGFESGLRHSDGDAKRAYTAFLLPLVAERRRSTVRLWGRVRPATGPTRVSVDFRPAGSTRWRLLKHDGTDADGVWGTTTALRSGRSYRVRWTAPGGERHVGPLTRVYRAR